MRRSILSALLITDDEGGGTLSNLREHVVSKDATVKAAGPYLAHDVGRALRF